MGEKFATRGWPNKVVRRFLPKSRLTRSIGLLAGGAALGQAVTVLVSPVLTRLYSAEDFGVFGVYASLLGIFTVIASLRYEFALPLPEKDETAANILALCFVLLIGMSAATWVAVQGLGGRIVAWANVPNLKPYLWLIPLGVLGAGSYQILNYWTVRKRDFPRIARTKMTRGFARASLQVGLGAVAPGPLGLLLGQVAGETAGSSSLAWAGWKKDRAILKAVSWANMRKAGSRYRRFPLFSSGANLLDTLGLQLPQILFAVFYGAGAAGWFALAQRVIAAPLNIVVDSVAQVFFGEGARISRDEPQSLKRLVFKLMGRMALIGSLPIVLICASAPWFFSFVFGPGWEAAGLYVRIMGLMFAVRFAIIPLSHTLNILERQDLYLLWDGIRLALVAGAFLAAKIFGFSHIETVGIYTLSMVTAYLLLGVIVWRVLTRARRGCQDRPNGFDSSFKNEA